MSNFREYFKNHPITIWPDLEPVLTPVLQPDPNESFVIKDENLQPNGSFKDRCLFYQLGVYLSQKKNHFCISSSGNAAISSINMLPKEAELKVFIGENISQEKKEIIMEQAGKNVEIIFSRKPRSRMIQFLNENAEFTSLRGSVDDNAIPGFRSIAYELAEQYSDIDAIFIPCSSGTSAVGIHQGFQELEMKVSINIIQTTSVNAIARKVLNIGQSEQSLADAIVDRVAHRRDQVLDILKQTGGSAFIATNQDLINSKEYFKELGYDYSYNSLLSHVGYLKSQLEDKEYKKPVLLFSGR